MIKFLLPSVVFAIGLAFVPVKFDAKAMAVTANNAYCEKGNGATCCAQNTSICYPNECSTPECSVANRYERTDGLPC